MYIYVYVIFGNTKSIENTRENPATSAEAEYTLTPGRGTYATSSEARKSCSNSLTTLVFLASLTSGASMVPSMMPDSLLVEVREPLVPFAPMVQQQAALFCFATAYPLEQMAAASAPRLEQMAAASAPSAVYLVPTPGAELVCGEAGPEIS